MHIRFAPHPATGKDVDLFFFCYTTVMFYELYIYCKVIFIICTIYTVILILKISLTGLYHLACPMALKIIEPALTSIECCNPKIE
jgi:hypothetical protein